MMNLPVYLDYNATTPVDQEVLEAMLPYFTAKFGNAASRNHAFGWVAEEAADKARSQVAGLIGASEKEIIFTSGATEAINLAIKGVFERYKGKGNHIITCVTEHKAVLDTCAHIERLGGTVTYLPVKHDGTISLSDLEAAFTAETILVAIMYANNETGLIHPVSEMSAIAHRNGALFFTDATQAAGKIPIDVNTDGIDLMAFSSHKLYGPKGAGALYVRRRSPRVRIAAQIDGGGHEQGMRSGTLNVPGIVGFGKACELCSIRMQDESARLKTLRDKLENTLLSIEQSGVNGNRHNRLPHVTNMWFRHTEAEALIARMKDVAVSSGSACSSASLEPSHVLKSMGLPDEMAQSSIRFGLGRFTTEEEIDFTIERTIQSVNKIRSDSPLWQMLKEEADLK